MRSYNCLRYSQKESSALLLDAVVLHVANNLFAYTGDVTFGVLAELLVLIVVYLLAWRFCHQASKEKMVV